MQPLHISAATAVSALGVGAAAQARALRQGQGGLTPNNYEPAVGGFIGRVPGLEQAPLPAAFAQFDCRNNRLALLALTADGFTQAVAAAAARHGAHRVAVVLGTSTSGVTAAEDAYAARDANGALPPSFDYAHTQDLASLGNFTRQWLGLRGPLFMVSTACASSARACMDAAQLIEAGLCDAAVVGGADSLCRMTLQGFAALELIAATPCRPGAADRAGISIGEASGFALLERATGPIPGQGFALLGAGASSDGYHMSSPHPEGAGAVAAMRQALASASLAPEAIDWVHLHGTGTRANDAMEDQAVLAVCGPATPCSSTKGYTGHTLGACGILGLVMARDCVAQGFIPASLGLTAADPSFRSNTLTTTRTAPMRHVLANAFGFGGTNCSLVLGPLP